MIGMMLLFLERKNLRINKEKKNVDIKYIKSSVIFMFANEIIYYKL